MKKRDFLKEIKSLEAAELKAKVLQLSEELMKIRFRKVSGQLEQSHRIREIKRQIAAIKTLLSAQMRDSSAAEQAQGS